MKWRDRIAVDPDVLVGKPVIKGTRIAVEFVIALMARGWTTEQILDEYDHLTTADVQACLMYAGELLEAQSGERAFVRAPSPGNCHMNETLVVSRRGQITLPALLRRRLGIQAGDVMLLEDRGHEVVLKPHDAIEVETYSDDQIAKWDADDRLTERDRKRIVDRLARSR